MTVEKLGDLILDSERQLYLTAKGILFNEADVEDAVQEALRRAWEKRAFLRNDSYIRTWIIRILLNVCHDIRREKKRMIPTEEFPEASAPSAYDSIVLKECLLQLEERDRMPILLYYIEGYDVKEAASILRIPQGTVKSRLNRGRSKLKEICREEVFES